MAELRPYKPSLRERLAMALMDTSAKLGAGRYAQQDIDKRTRQVLDFIPGVGDAVAADDARHSWQQGDKLGAAINAVAAALGVVPGVGDVAGKALKMDRASRLKRAADQGYLEQPFWHGRADPNPTQPMPNATYYSADRDYSVGIGKSRGGAAREYRLRPEKTLDMNAPASTHVLADFAEGLLQSGDAQGAASLISAFVDYGGSPAQFVRAARSGPAQELGLSGGAIKQVLEMSTGGSWEGALRNAGYDSLNTGRDMIMLTPQGQRRVTARFDPKQIDSSNLLAGTIGGAVAIPAALYASQDKE